MECRRQWLQMRSRGRTAHGVPQRAEVAVHPAEQPSHELYLMCDDLAATIARLSDAGATFGPIRDERWGRVAVMTMPGGAQLPIYQPSHPSPILAEGQAGRLES